MKIEKLIENLDGYLRENHPEMLVELNKRREMVANKQGLMFQSLKTLSPDGIIFKKALGKREKVLRDALEEKSNQVFQKELDFIKANKDTWLENRTMLGNKLKNIVRLDGIVEVAAEGDTLSLYAVYGEEGEQHVNVTQAHFGGDFEVCGNCSGLIGVVNTIPETSYVDFFTEGGNLFVIEKKFNSKGQLVYNKKKIFGTLITQSKLDGVIK